MAACFWSSSKECWAKMYSKALSLTVLPSMLVRKASNGSMFWGSSKECRVKLCSETINYNADIGACEKGKRWPQGLELFNTKMLGVEVQRDTITFNVSICACEKGREWRQALELSRRMRCKRVQQNTIDYSAAISACEKGGQWQKALEFFERMMGACVCAANLYRLQCCHQCLRERLAVAAGLGALRKNAE